MNPAYRDERIALLVREYGADRVLDEVFDLCKREGRGSELDETELYEKAYGSGREKGDEEGFQRGHSEGDAEGYSRGFLKAKEACEKAIEEALVEVAP